MKKILYSLIAVLAMVMSSCSNDDIEVFKTGGVTVNVNTQSVYNEFGMDDIIRDFIRDENKYGIKVFSFLYDNNGKLLDKKETLQFDCNTASFTYNGLSQGDYTLLLVETIVEAQSGESPYWKFENTESLAEVRVAQKLDNVHFAFVLGACTEHISIDKKDQMFSFTPKGIGSMIKFYAYDFAKSNFVDVGLGTDDRIQYYRFNPKLSHSEKFHTDRTTSEYFRLRGGKKIVATPYSFIPCYVLEDAIDYSFRFTKNEDASNKGEWTYYKVNSGHKVLEEGKTYYAGFYYVDEETVPMGFFGENEADFNTWYESSVAKILMPLLYTNWGGTVEDAQSFMSLYSMTLGKWGKAELMDDGSYEIDYKGKGKASMIAYSFKTQTTGLFEVDIRYPKTKVTKNEILSYLNNNYNFIVSQDDIYMYMSADEKTVASLLTVGNEWNVAFIDKDYLISQSNEIEIVKPIYPDALLTPYMKKMK